MKDDNFNQIKIKKYGQVFSGEKLGNLLVEMLPDDLRINTVVDPMVGQGDLLGAILKKHPNTKKVIGIDIDKDIIETCKNNIPDAHIYCEDAFKSEILDCENGWDLVITNPPYIRYQTLKHNNEFGLPNGEEIRLNLIEHIKKTKILNDSDKKLYLGISENYSGLSDMAVPSWILCASIVKENGYLAMVVPETWLNRDYARPIHYLLMRCFDIEAIVRDSDSHWFEGAQVRTCLVVCKRKNNTAISKNNGHTTVFDISKLVSDDCSFVGELEFEGAKGYAAFKKVLKSRNNNKGNGFESKRIFSKELFPGLISEVSLRKWALDEDRENNEIYYLPIEFVDLIDSNPPMRFESLESQGWFIGQGLRTGANEFFYADLKKRGENVSIIQTEEWYGKEFIIDSDNIRVALKKRSDVEGNVVDCNSVKKCIIYIQNQIRNEDSALLAPSLTEKYSIMNSELSDYICAAEEYISPSHRKHFSELSAVVTNIRKTEDGFERFWYMLPELKNRHTPNLCMSRVCGGSPEVLFVNQIPGKEIIVDANFITLWNHDLNSSYIALTLLNSTWAKAFLEFTGTTMGGGALKIEASHIRRLVFPIQLFEEQDKLEAIGKTIISRGLNEETQKEIDEIVFSSFGDKGNDIKERIKIKLSNKLKERAGH